MTLTVTIPTLQTERLTLRAPRMEDVEPFDMFLRSDRAQFIGGPVTDDKAIYRAFTHMAGLWVLRGFGPLIWTLGDGTPIGHGGPWQPKGYPHPELGWCLWSDANEGQGYAFEAMTALRNWSASRGLAPLWAGIEAENIRSMALATRLGLTRAPRDRTPDGEAVPTFWLGEAPA